MPTESFFVDLLGELGAPVTDENLRFLRAWSQAEGTGAANNPLATTKGGYEGESDFNRAGVKVYPTSDIGVRATADTLRLNHYRPILAGLRSGETDAEELGRRVAQSPWGTGRGILRVLNAVVPAAEAAGTEQSDLDAWYAKTFGGKKPSAPQSSAGELDEKALDDWYARTFAAAPKPVAEKPAEARSAQEAGPAMSGAPSWSEIPGQALSNLPESAMKMAEQLYQTVRHPLQTAQGLGQVGMGAAEKLGAGIASTLGMQDTEERLGPPRPPSKNEQKVNDLLDSLGERYGSIDALKKTMATDPVGFLADASSVLGGGAALTGSKILGKAAALTDPFRIAGAAVKGTAKVVGRRAAEALGVTTGIGAKGVLRAAEENPLIRDTPYYQALKAKDHTAVLEMIKDAITQLRRKSSEDFQKGFDEIKAKHPDPIDAGPLFDDIESGLKKFHVKWTGAGKDAEFDFSKSGIIDPQERGAMSNLMDEVNSWDDFTPAGLHVLKKHVDAFYKEAKASRALVASLRDSIKRHIVQAAPEYGPLMRQSEDQIGAIEEIEKALSAKRKGNRLKNADTLHRKLSTVFRDANKERLNALKDLEKRSGKDVTGAVAGMASSSFLPREHLGKLLGMGEIAGAALLSPKALLGLPLLSPRVIGEVAPAVGSAYRGINALAAPAVKNALLGYQLGRVGGDQQNRLQDLVDSY